MFIRPKPKKSFTLVELLVVVGIIAILSALVITAINPVQLRRVARDSNRKKDLQIVASALEQYYADNNSYPTSNDFNQLKTLLEGGADGDGPVYMRVVPSRQPSDEPGSQYCYRPSGASNPQEFLLCAPMEADPTVIPVNYIESEIRGPAYCGGQLALPEPLEVNDSTSIHCITSPF